MEAHQVVLPWLTLTYPTRTSCALIVIAETSLSWFRSENVWCVFFFQGHSLSKETYINIYFFQFSRLTLGEHIACGYTVQDCKSHACKKWSIVVLIKLFIFSQINASCLPNDGWMDGRTVTDGGRMADGRTDVWTEGRTNEWMDETCT